MRDHFEDVFFILAMFTIAFLFNHYYLVVSTAWLLRVMHREGALRKEFWLPLFEAINNERGNRRSSR